MKILRIFLVIMSLNLLVTNTDLLMTARNITADNTAMLLITGAFAITYSAMAALVLWDLRYPVLGCIFGLVFAVMDRWAIKLDLYQTTPESLSEYFATYTAVFMIMATALIVANIIRPKGKGGKTDDATLLDGKDAKYWHDCFTYQKERAERLFERVKDYENHRTPDKPETEPETEPEPVAKAENVTTEITDPKKTDTADNATQQTAKKPPTAKKPQRASLPEGVDVKLTEGQNAVIVGIHRSFNRTKDPVARRKRLALVSDPLTRWILTKEYFPEEAGEMPSEPEKTTATAKVENENNEGKGADGNQDTDGTPDTDADK